MIKYNNKMFQSDTRLSTKHSSVEITESATGWHFLLPCMVNIAECSMEKDNNNNQMHSGESLVVTSVVLLG